MSKSLNFPTVMPSLLLDFANTKRLDPRVTFTRASTATYYDEDTVAKAEENLLLQSQTLDTASWGKNDITVSADANTAPDSTTTADKLAETATTATHVITQTITLTAVPYTYSVFVKAAERGYALVSQSTAHGISVDLATGAATLAVGSPTNITSTNAGSGWWRVSFTFTPSAGATNMNIYASTDGVWANRSYAGSAGSGILVWGAQLEQRASVTAYTVTTTQPITNYIPVLMTAAVGVPRFNFNPTTRESLGLLIEEQRVNLSTYSADFSNAAWTKTQSSITSNTIVAPDGTLTGDKLIPDTTAGVTHNIVQTINVTSGTYYTFSCYMKKAEYYVGYLGLTGGGNGFGADFIAVVADLNAGTVTTATGSGTAQPFSYGIQDAGNGWYRLWMTALASSTVGSLPRIYAVNGSSYADRTAAGDGFSGVYIWGAQMEAGAFPTSYIPTVASSVTRSADTASMTGVNFSQWYRADEGTMYAEWSQPQTSSISRVFQFDDGSANNRTYIGASNNGIEAVISGGTTQASITAGTITVNTFAKLASCYKFNDFAISVNASSVATDTSGIVPLVDRARIGSNETGGNVVNGTVKKVAYYPARLTNAQLQALTS